MARREYKTGSVYQRASDGLWIGTLEAGTNGNQRRRRITVSGKTKAVVQRKLRDKRLQIEREGLPSASARKTVKRWAEGWLEGRRATVRAKPWSSDASAVRKWIVPTIGHRRLDELTPADVRAVATAQRQAGLSSSTALRAHATLTSLLRAAMLDGHQVPPRVLMVKPPAKAVSTREAMPADQLEDVLSEAMRTLPHWSRWLVQALYGQRPAEVLGLTDEVLDFDRKLIRVEWQLQTLPYVDRADKARGFVIPDGMPVRHLTAAWHLTPPKTRKGYRVVPMLPIVEAALEEWAGARERILGGPSPYGLVWPRDDGRPRSEFDDRREWQALQRAVGAARPDGELWSIYEARHGFATRLLEGGVDERVVTELMGHSSIVVSRGYQHVTQERALEALQQINAGLGQGRAPAALEA